MYRLKKNARVYFGSQKTLPRCCLPEIDTARTRLTLLPKICEAKGTYSTIFVLIETLAAPK